MELLLLFLSALEVLASCSIGVLLGHWLDRGVRVLVDALCGEGRVDNMGKLGIVEPTLDVVLLSKGFELLVCEVEVEH